ncbi:MAG: imidazole glycerol phosphate synthase subunit HisH [Verrucomicrobiota bacterium]|nr:imidazole glycerol phosphate synthase subunit HisH [Verrucomicrobiota bacterium]
MIALIDYGAGNLRSVHKALLHLGVEVRRVTDPSGLEGCPGIVLPGVGAFEDCSTALISQSMMEATRQRIEQGTWFLGICVGYQILFDHSEEFQSNSPGFGHFKGPVVRFPKKPGLKVPQIGWNQVKYIQPDCPIFKDIPDNSHFYFVHSYHPKPEDTSIIAGETEYEIPFASAVWHDRVFATQFHPEKSQSVGLQLLKNFVDLI